MGKYVTSESLRVGMIVWLCVLVLSMFCEVQAHLAGIKPLVNNYNDHNAGSCGPSMLSH